MSGLLNKLTTDFGGQLQTGLTAFNAAKSAVTSVVSNVAANATTSSSSQDLSSGNSDTTNATPLAQSTTTALPGSVSAPNIATKSGAPAVTGSVSSEDGAKRKPTKEEQLMMLVRKQKKQLEDKERELKEAQGVVSKQTEELEDLRQKLANHSENDGNNNNNTSSSEDHQATLAVIEELRAQLDEAREIQKRLEEEAVNKEDSWVQREKAARLAVETLREKFEKQNEADSDKDLQLAQVIITA